MANIQRIRSLWVLLLVVLVLPVTPAMAQSQPATVQTFRDLGYGNRTANTMYGSLAYFFPVAPGQVPRSGSELRLRFSHSPLLIPDRSTMTVVVNGQSITSVFLTEANADQSRLEVPLPVDGFAGEGFFVQVLFSLRLTRDECEETQNPALWATVHGDSVVAIRTQRADEQPGLEDLDLLFAPAYQAETPLSLGLPPVLEPETLAAAGLVALQTGQRAARTGQDLRPLEVTTALEADLLVGSGSQLDLSDTWGALEWDGEQFATTAGTVPAEHGVLALRNTDTPQLLVSGSEPTAVRTAAGALVLPEQQALLTDDYTIITDGSPVGMTAALPWQAGAASFAQLGVARRALVGVGAHTLDLLFERPAGWQLKPGSELSLALGTSPALDSATSWVAVSVNGFDIGTQQLAAGADGSEPYRFTLPADLLNSDLEGQPIRRLALQVRFYLDLPQRGCTQVTPDSAWATLLPVSAWQLPHEPYAGRDLGRFPAPLLDADPTVSLAVVLPAEPTNSELTAGLTVMAALGRWAAGGDAPLPRLLTADQVAATMYTQQNLILIGGTERNAVSRAVAAEAAALFEPATPAAYRTTVAQHGMLRLAASPWSEQRTILLMLAEDAQGLLLAADVLRQSETLHQLQGQVAMVVNDLPPQTLAAAEPFVSPPAALVPRVETPMMQRLPAWQVIGAVLLGGFVSALVFIGKARYRRKGQG
jgi:cellulose synthase operon protein B